MPASQIKQLSMGEDKVPWRVTMEMTNSRSVAVYNSRKTQMLRLSPDFSSRVPVLAIAVCFCLTATCYSSDWTTAEQELARKIAAVIGPGTVALDVVNRSSLNRKDVDEISRGLRMQLEAAGIRAVKPEQAAATVTVSLSENVQSYVWVAEIQQGAGDFSVVLASALRPDGASPVHEATPVTIRKSFLWSQEERILDVAVLEETSSPSRLVVLDGEKVALYRLSQGRWQQEQVFVVTHSHPWPRDLRGRLALRQDHLFDAYLPGVFCQSSNTVPLNLICRESDNPWPLSSQVALGAFFASTRNFFTGALSPGIGKQTSTGGFYSAAPIPRPNYTLWVLAGVDGQVHLVDGLTDQAAHLNWGSDLASVRTSCGSGWQMLVTQAGSSDSVRAYEMPDREPVVVSEPLEFAGGITALWSEAKGTSAVAVVRSAETGSYEAFRLAVTCQ